MPEQAPARSIYILILLFLINLMNFFDRTIPAVVLEPIRKEFSLDDTALGILGASFTLIYAVAGVTALDRPIRRILAIPTVWWIIASGATVNFAAYAMSTFLPTMLIRYHELSISKAGLIAALVLGATGLVGLTAGGWLADYLHKKFLRGRLLLASFSMLVATPLLYFGLAQPAGAANAATILLSLGWLLYFSYYCSVYSALQDVVEPRLRATAMAVYFFFQYVLGAGFGTVVTGALSDLYARQAMTAAGSSQMTDAFRAIGLQSAMALVVPLAIALTCVSLFFAARSFIAEARKTASVAERVCGLATAS